MPILPRMTADHVDLPSQRMIELIAALKADLGIPQARLKPLVGMGQSNISKLKNGEKQGLSAEYILTAQQQLGLDPRYFFDAILRGDGTYHAYLRRSDAERESHPIVPAANSNTAPLQDRGSRDAGRCEAA